jgi:hypothetical protein
VNKHRSERPVKPRRPVRRSMVVLAASLKSGATEDSPLARPLAPQQHSPATSLRQNARVTTNILMDYANGLAAASPPLGLSSETAGQPPKQEIESGMSQREATEAAQEYREEAFKLITAYVNANLQYAHKLTRLTTPFEFIELSTDHARKQFELIMSQTAALGALSRSLTMAKAERMTAGIESVFGGRKI